MRGETAQRIEAKSDSAAMRVVRADGAWMLRGSRSCIPSSNDYNAGAPPTTA
jgi:hypothetical protein